MKYFLVYLAVISVITAIVTFYDKAQSAGNAFVFVGNSGW